MIVGYMGDIPFMVSRRYLLTIDEFVRNGTGRWAKHDILSQKPSLEFLGPDLDEITFKISLRRDHGVNPEQVLKKLRKMRDTGEVFPLVLGGQIIGDLFMSLIKGRPFGSSSGLWTLLSLSEPVKHWHGGSIYIVETNVTLKEYTGRMI